MTLSTAEGGARPRGPSTEVQVGGAHAFLNAAPPYGAPLKGALPADAERHARGPELDT